jgi:AcrR family transcriptional regulator
VTRQAPGENREQRRAEIVRAGLALLERGGFDRLSLRGVARALGMHPAGLYWYIKNKQELIDLLAKAIMDEALLDYPAPAPDASWEEWLAGVALAIRQTVLAHRDGARLIAGAYLMRTDAITPMLETTLMLMERAGFVRDAAMIGAVTVLGFTIGFALDEQASPPMPPWKSTRQARAALRRGPLIDAERWPRLADVMSRWVEEMLTLGPKRHELHFRRGLALVIAGVRSAPKGVG